MSRCFRELGLSENATKAQVEAAYARKVERYKGPDYAEEPEYVHRKLMDLKAAYEEAYLLAGNDNTEAYIPVSASYEDKARKKNKSVKKVRDGKKGGMLDDIKNIDAEKLKSAWKEFKSDAFGLSTTPLFADDDDDKSFRDDETFDNRFDDDAYDETYEDTYDEDTSFGDTYTVDSGERIGEDGTISAPKKKKSKGSEIVSLIATLLIAGMTFFGSCGDDAVTYEEEYDQNGYDYDYLYNYEEIEDMDKRISGYASSTDTLLYTQGEEGTATTIDEEPEDYRGKADHFVQSYWHFETVEDVTDYLFEEYADYPVSSGDPLNVQLDAIFAFYGFSPMETAVWYKNPYTSGRMRGYADYLDYLNQYYDEMIAE